MRNYRAGLAKWQTADPMGYTDGWNQLAYCGNRIMTDVDFHGCVSFTVEGAVKEAFKDLLDGIFNTDSIENFLRGFFRSLPADNIHVYGFLSIQVTNILIYYNHFLSGDCVTSPDNYMYSTPIDFVIERSQPEIYIRRNRAGDRDGPSWQVGNGTPLNLDVPLSITESFLGYNVNVTRMVCDYNLITDGHTRYLNYVRE